MTTTEDLLKDFVSEEYKEFEVDGRKFKYKPVTAGDENDWINEYLEIGEDGKTRQNIKKLNECKLRNLVEVPYTREVIQKILNIDKEWKDLGKEQRLSLLKKLNPRVFSAIITNINSIDRGDVGDTKNP